MWDHYQKTFLRMQIVMGMAACLPVLATRSLLVGFQFWVLMQAGALLGAWWAARIRRRTEFPADLPRSDGLDG